MTDRFFTDADEPCSLLDLKALTLKMGERMLLSDPESWRRLMEARSTSLAQGACIDGSAWRMRSSSLEWREADALVVMERASRGACDGLSNGREACGVLLAARFRSRNRP